jgi:adenylate cyclase
MLSDIKSPKAFWRRATGRAQIQTIHPQTLAEYHLDLRFERMIDSGPVFDKMSATLEGIASQSGMTGVFSLAGLAELEVLDWCKTVQAGAEPPSAEPGVDPIERLERISAAMGAAGDLDALLDATFAALAAELGLEHGFLLLADGEHERLYNVASFGFQPARFGAEISFGEGIYGTAAARQISMRTGSMSRERLMAQAVARESAQEPHPWRARLQGPSSEPPAPWAVQKQEC